MDTGIIPVVATDQDSHEQGTDGDDDIGTHAWPPDHPISLEWPDLSATFI